MAPSRNGMAKKMSVIRETTASIQPPKKPARVPMTTPTLSVTMVVATPTRIDARAP